MKILFESTGNIFGTNQKFMDSIPVKYVPTELRNAIMGVPTKSCPFTLMLPDGKAGAFYYSPERRFVCICAGESIIGTNGEFESAKIIVFLGNLDKLDKDKSTSWKVLCFYERSAKDSSVSNRSKKTNSLEFSLDSDFARSSIKKVSTCPDFDTASRKLLDLKKQIRNKLELD